MKSHENVHNCAKSILNVQKSNLAIIDSYSKGQQHPAQENQKDFVVAKPKIAMILDALEDPNKKID